MATVFYMPHCLFMLAADEASNPGMGPLPRDTPDAKRNKGAGGPGFLESRGQGGFTAGSEAAIKLAQRNAARSRGGGS